MSDPNTDVQLRLASHSDAAAIERLIAASVRGLMHAAYSERQLAIALGTALGLDTQLIVDQTYFVAETPHHELVGCGGWSHRRTLCGSDHALVRENAFLDPEKDAARIRAFFVHPTWVRRRVGARILATCEDAALRAGFRRFELAATLTGVALYAAHGYREIERMEIALADGESLPVVRMDKSPPPG